MTNQLDHRARRFEIEGKDLGYPTDFRDGSAALGLFVVPASEANALIANSGFVVAKILPGKAFFSLSCVHLFNANISGYGLPVTWRKAAAWRPSHR